MSDLTITIAAGGEAVPLSDLHSEDIRRVRMSLETTLRNVEIRRRYRELRRTHRKLPAIEALVEEYCLSESAIDLILWPRAA